MIPGLEVMVITKTKGSFSFEIYSFYIKHEHFQPLIIIISETFDSIQLMEKGSRFVKNSNLDLKKLHQISIENFYPNAKFPIHKKGNNCPV